MEICQLVPALREKGTGYEGESLRLLLRHDTILSSTILSADDRQQSRTRVAVADKDT